MIPLASIATPINTFNNNLSLETGHFTKTADGQPKGEMSFEWSSSAFGKQ